MCDSKRGRLAISALMFVSLNRDDAGGLYYREVMVFVSGIAAVVALLTLLTLIKRNVGQPPEGTYRTSDYIGDSLSGSPFNGSMSEVLLSPLNIIFVTCHVCSVR